MHEYTIYSSARDSNADENEIRLRPEDNQWIARDVETGITTQGWSGANVLLKLDETVYLHNDEIGREPTDEAL
jgi:hypothetical protein